MRQVNLKIVDIALEKVSTADFERFVNAFCPSVLGVDFIPTGEMHDGGADAYESTGLFEGKRPGIFYQASTQEDHRAKIRGTIGRLKTFGREPKSLVYITSRPIQTPDSEEETLSAELDVFIKIRPRGWIVGNMHNSAAALSAFDTYLAPHVAYMNDAGGATFLTDSKHLMSRSVCVFLGQEVERRRRDSRLLESITDSLILWSLDKTDPDKEIFLTREEIQERIETAFPPSKNFIRGVLSARLIALSKKNNTAGREIRSYIPHIV